MTKCGARIYWIDGLRGFACLRGHNMQTNTTRDTTIDFIKGILILFVILGHTTLGLTDMYSFDDTMNGIANVIYSFHMPCFIAVSGFLYSEYVGNASQGIFSRIGHKAFNILLPYVMISVIYWIIKLNLPFQI